MNIGLTGGIASGKSTVAQMLVNKGACLVDADKIAREVVEPGSPILDKVVSHFGQTILHEDGTLNRKLLGDIIFHHPSQKKALESMLHPPVRAMMLERMHELEVKNPSRLVVVDIPLLFESNLTSYFEEIWVVYVPEKVQLKRLMARNHWDESTALSRIKAQMPIEQKKELADVVIDNSGSLSCTKFQIDQHWDRKGLE